MPKRELLGQELILPSNGEVIFSQPFVLDAEAVGATRLFASVGLHVISSIALTTVLLYACDQVVLSFDKGGAFGLFFDPTVSAEAIKGAELVPTVDFLFQAAFAGTAATIVSGLVAERIKFGEFVLFAVVLTAFIYPVAGSWKWNDGWLDQMGFIDFAGSSIVHSVGAWACLLYTSPSPRD